MCAGHLLKQGPDVLGKAQQMLRDAVQITARDSQD